MWLYINNLLTSTISFSNEHIQVVVLFAVPGLEDDEEEALDQLRMLEEEMHDMCSVPWLIYPIPYPCMVFLPTFTIKINEM